MINRVGPIVLGVVLALLIVVGAVQAQALFPNMIGGCFPGNCPLGGSGGGGGIIPQTGFLELEVGGLILEEGGGRIIIQTLPGLMLSEAGVDIDLESGGKICLQGNASCS